MRFFWRWWKRPPAKPKLSFMEWTQIMKFRYTFKLAEPSEPVTRNATVVVNGEASTVVVENNELTQDFAINEIVSVSFFDVDGAGNQSQPTIAMQDKTIVDDVAPEAPGVEICVEQVADEAPVEPPVEPPTPPEVPPTEQVEQEDGEPEAPPSEPPVVTDPANPDA